MVGSVGTAFSIPAVAMWLAGSVGSLVAQAPTPSLDTRPAFMQVVTNKVLLTNYVVVTNMVVSTSLVLATNLYNAQGVLLQPVTPPAPGLIPIPPAPVASNPTPAPDPAAIKAQQLKGVRELLNQSLANTSNKLSATGSFTANLERQIQIPQGLTSFDRRKSQSLIVAMNQTAEKATPAVIALLSKTVGNSSFEDPASLVQSGPDGASKTFVAVQRGALEPQVLAIIQQAGTDVRLRHTYSSVMIRGGGLLGAVLGAGPTVDIEAHVGQELLNAVGRQMATEEAAIRKDPALRKTPALQEIFKK